MDHEKIKPLIEMLMSLNIDRAVYTPINTNKCYVGVHVGDAIHYVKKIEDLDHLDIELLKSEIIKELEL